MSGETEQQVSGWTVDTLHAKSADDLRAMEKHLQRQLDDMREMLHERYETQTKAVDAAFLAQQTAMQTALTAAEKAVGTALESAEKAVTKAEVAAEKRFESVNEFRAQLTDQAATFLSRTEADVRIGALGEKLEAGLTTSTEKIDAGMTRNGARFAEIEARLNTFEGRAHGEYEQARTQRSNLAAMIGVVGVILTIITVVMGIILAITRSA